MGRALQQRATEKKLDLGGPGLLQGRFLRERRNRVFDGFLRSSCEYTRRTCRRSDADAQVLQGQALPAKRAAYRQDHLQEV